MNVKEIRSKIDGSLLHIYYESSYNKRENVCPNDALIQIAEINLKRGDTFKAHKHIPTERTTQGTQETWIVLEGLIKVYYYDLDDTLLCTRIVGPGEITVTLRGGHNYECISDDAFVYEVKNGPYLGIEKDKVFLSEHAKQQLPETKAFYDKAMETSKDIKEGND